MAKRKTPKKSTKTPAAIRFEKQMRPRLLKANKQLREIVSSKLQSQAIHKVAPYKNWDLSKYDSSSNKDIIKGFSFSGMTTKKQMLQEARLINLFLSSPTSTYEGALKYTNEIDTAPWKKFMGMFGRQWKNVSDHAYSPEINDDNAKLSFKAYRMIEEQLGPEIIKQVYGSDRLIEYTYYMIDAGHDVEETVMQGFRLLKDAYEEKQKRRNSIRQKMTALPKIDWQSEDNFRDDVRSLMRRPRGSRKRGRR